MAPASSETIDVPDSTEWPERVKWAYEKEALGFYLTGHPLQEYELELRHFVRIPIAELDAGHSGHEIRLGGVVTGLAQKRSRKGDAYATFALEDLTGTIEVTVPVKAYEGCKEVLQTEAPIIVTGRYETEEDNGNSEPRFICSAVMKMDDIWNGVREIRIAIPVEQIDPGLLTALESLVTGGPKGPCRLEFELITDVSRLHILPNTDLRVAVNRSFVQAAEKLFGDKSVTLYT